MGAEANKGEAKRASRDERRGRRAARKAVRKAGRSHGASGESPMLKQLRRKFIALNMGVITLVVAVTFGVIIVGDLYSNVEYIYDKLDQALERATGIEALTGVPEDSAGQRGADGDGSGKARGVSLFDVDEGDFAASRNVNVDTHGKTGVAANPYIAVYRAVNGGPFKPATVYSAAIVPDEVLESVADEIWHGERPAGSFGDHGLFYMKRSLALDGNPDASIMYVAFAGMNALRGWQFFALRMSVLGVLALVALFVVSVLFSRWALRPVEAAWKQQRQFIADASHDLKTPLSVILANQSIIMENPQATIETQKQWVMSTQTQATHMKQMIDDMLTLASVDEGAKPPAAEVVDLSSAVTQQLLEFESVAFERNVTFCENIEQDICVRANPLLMTNLVQVLFDNACKYAGDGGTITVTLRVGDSGKQGVAGAFAELHVHNNGPIVSEEDLPHVFDRFYRASESRSGSGESHGLGLAIAAGICQQVGGSLGVMSTESEGTEFTARLPLATLQAKPSGGGISDRVF